MDPTKKESTELSVKVKKWKGPGTVIWRLEPHQFEINSTYTCTFETSSYHNNNKSIDPIQQSKKDLCF